MGDDSNFCVPAFMKLDIKKQCLCTDAVQSELERYRTQHSRKHAVAQEDS